jgi:hypothetical protein
MVLYANNAPVAIRIPCPHCKFVTRYDASYLEDAINEHKDIYCVSCDRRFFIQITLPDPPCRLTLDATDELVGSGDDPWPDREWLGIFDEPA